MRVMKWKPLEWLYHLKTLRLTLNGPSTDLVYGFSDFLLAGALPSLRTLKLSDGGKSLEVQQRSILALIKSLAIRGVYLHKNLSHSNDSAAILATASICAFDESLRASTEEMVGENFWSAAYTKPEGGRRKEILIRREEEEDIALSDLLLSCSDVKDLRSKGFRSEQLFQAGFDVSLLEQAWSTNEARLPKLCDECGGCDTSVRVKKSKIRKEFELGDVAEITLSCNSSSCNHKREVRVELVSEAMLMAIKDAIKPHISVISLPRVRS